MKVKFELDINFEPDRRIIDVIGYCDSQARFVEEQFLDYENIYSVKCKVLEIDSGYKEYC